MNAVLLGLYFHSGCALVYGNARGGEYISDCWDFRVDSVGAVVAAVIGEPRRKTLNDARVC